ncbi:hypothetical protein ACIGXM_14060 [Kitasatospora sp. NPDC052896]|uniref:hypothetical protein n=1 Tax=Kitasatospora sp. NPDC052896 TaxID=3364061 RepID=UPI0037C8472E
MTDLQLPVDVYVRRAAGIYLHSALDTLGSVRADLERTKSAPWLTPTLTDAIDQITSALSVLGRAQDHQEDRHV